MKKAMIKGLKFIGIALAFVFMFSVTAGIVQGVRQVNDSYTQLPNVSDEIVKETIKHEIKKDELKIVPLSFKNNDNSFEVKITKITNDDMLKIYVEYVNNSGIPVPPCESLSKIVSDGKQIEYNYDLNETLYEDIEDGVTIQSILVFPKVNSNSINLILKPGYTDLRISNIKV